MDNGVELKALPAATPADQDLRATRQDLIREIASGYGCPPFVAGATADTKYNNISARLISVHREMIVPMANNIRDRLAQAFKAVVSYDSSEILAGDLVTQMAHDIQSCGGAFLTVNEVRAVRGLDKIEGGDELRDTPVETEEDRTGEFPTDDGDLSDLPPED